MRINSPEINTRGLRSSTSLQYSAVLRKYCVFHDLDYDCQDRFLTLVLHIIYMLLGKTLSIILRLGKLTAQL